LREDGKKCKEGIEQIPLTIGYPALVSTNIGKKTVKNNHRAREYGVNLGSDCRYEDGVLFEDQEDSR
jgi:hypothetical protein